MPARSPSSNRTQAIGLHFISYALLCVVACWLLWPHAEAVAGLNLEKLFDGLTAYTTGVMIAIFLAVFAMNNPRVKLLRAHAHARTIFYLILLDLLCVVAAGALLVDGQPTMQTASLVVMVVFSGSVTRMIFKLVRIGIS